MALLLVQKICFSLQRIFPFVSRKKEKDSRGQKEREKKGLKPYAMNH